MTISGMSSMNNVYAMMSSGAMQRSDPFQKVDSDGDGSVNQSELESFAAQIEEITGESIDVAEALESFDADGDGALNQEEMKSFVDESGFAPPPPPPPPGGMAAGAMQPPDPFQNVDEDGDGVVSESELDTFASFIEETTGESIDVSEALASYDADGDGALNEEEMTSFVEESGFAPPPPPPHGGPAGIAENDEDQSAYEALYFQAISAYAQNSGENDLYSLLSSGAGDTLTAQSLLDVTT